MKKPVSMVIEDFKQNIINSINSSGLHISVVDLILGQVYNDIHYTATQVAKKEKDEYSKNEEKENS
ncbi:MAG: hypothetical protein II304_03545 [Bacteroidales bacterium]|nr:hypothetical protein [Bacteroidales bacterium]